MRNIIFLSVLFIVGMTSCEPQDAENGLKGTWEVEWQDNQETLFGEITLFDNHAHLIAFGNEDNPLLNKIDQAEYHWKLTGDKLILIRNDSNIELPLTVYETGSDYWKFTYLADIRVSFRRKSSY